MFIYGWIYLDLKYQGRRGEEGEKEGDDTVEKQGEGGRERVMIFTIFMFHLSLTNV